MPMSKIQKKKFLMIIIGALALLVALIGIVIALSLQPHANIWNEPRETDILLPEPAYVKMYYGEVEYSLSQGTQMLVYQTVSRWFDTAEECNRTPDELPKNHAYVRFEFGFNGPYAYTEGRGTEQSPSNAPFVYSTISLSFARPDFTSSYHAYLTPHGDGTRFTTDKLKTSVMLGWQELASNQTFDNLVLTAMLNTPPANAGSEVVESNVFPAKPDSAVITQNGKAVLLTGEKLDELYQVFMQMKTDAVHVYSACSEGYFSFEALNHTCVQFHYLKRQKYVPDTIVESDFGGVQTTQQFYQGIEYDAQLFIVKAPNPNSDATQMIVNTYANGSYTLSPTLMYASFVKKEFVPFLEQLLNAKEK